MASKSTSGCRLRLSENYVTTTMRPAKRKAGNTSGYIPDEDVMVKRGGEGHKARAKRLAALEEHRKGEAKRARNRRAKALKKGRTAVPSLGNPATTTS